MHPRCLESRSTTAYGAHLHDESLTLLDFAERLFVSRYCRRPRKIELQFEVSARHQMLDERRFALANAPVTGARTVTQPQARRRAGQPEGTVAGRSEMNQTLL